MNLKFLGGDGQGLAEGGGGGGGGGIIAGGGEDAAAILKSASSVESPLRNEILLRL